MSNVGLISYKEYVLHGYEGEKARKISNNSGSKHYIKLYYDMKYNLHLI
jgi:hypothetical protein